jgi:hypothetical protein
MVVAVLRGHAPARTHLRTVGLFEDDPACRFCREEAETVQRIVCCCEALDRQRYSIFGTVRRTKRYKRSLSKGPLPLCKGDRAIESVLKGIFRVAQ